MEVLGIYLFLAASVIATAAVFWWVGYQMGREEGAAPSVDLEALYGPAADTATTDPVVPLP